jgi:hypothetical protein
MAVLAEAFSRLELLLDLVDLLHTSRMPTTLELGIDPNFNHSFN